MFPCAHKLHKTQFQYNVRRCTALCAGCLTVGWAPTYAELRLQNTRTRANSVSCVKMYVGQAGECGVRFLLKIDASLRTRLTHRARARYLRSRKPSQLLRRNSVLSLLLWFWVCKYTAHCESDAVVGCVYRFIVRKPAKKMNDERERLTGCVYRLSLGNRKRIQTHVRRLLNCTVVFFFFFSYLVVIVSLFLYP